MGAQESAREAYKLIERTSEGVFFMGGEHRKRELVSSNLIGSLLWKTLFLTQKGKPESKKASGDQSQNQYRKPFGAN